MGVIHNEILIQAPVDKIWNVLATPGLLEKYDPAVLKSSVISDVGAGLSAKRRVEMRDGKNWFEEKITVYKPNEALTYELTACSFPVHKLKHSYTFEKAGDQTKVTQIMEYTVKFGLPGRLLDVLVIRRQSDAGIKKFFAGLKSYVQAQ
jgi:ligand-binding SRPBCC domain-containing protein